MSTDLTAALRAALDAREATARAAAERGDDPAWHVMNDGFTNKVAYGSSVPRSETAVARTTCSEYAVHIAANGPAFVLADIAAKRKLIERGGPFCTSGCDEPGGEPMDPDTDWTTPLEHHLDCGAYEAAKILAEAYGIRA